MARAIIHELASNAAILLVLSFLYVQIRRRWESHHLLAQVLNGILFGGVAVGVMLSPLHLLPGVVFDTRSVVISVSGLFGGPLVGAITFIMASLYRVWLGGDGTLMGVLVSFCSAGLGVAYFFWKRRNPGVMTVFHLYGFGLLVHVVMLACTLTLPGELTWRVLRDIALPVIIIYPPATLLIALLMRDMEAQLEAGRRLRASEERYRRIVDTANEGIWVIDPSQQTLFVNQEMVDMLGCQPDQVIGRSVREFIPSEDLAIHERQMEDRRKGISDRYEHRFQRLDGSLGWAIISATPLFEDGLFAGSLAMYTDISARKQTELDLQERAELLDLAHDSILVRDLDDRIQFWNRGAAEIYGWSREEALGRVTHELLSTQFPQPLAEIMAMVLRDGRWEGELTHTRRDGSRIVVASRWALRRGEQGQPQAVLEINNDISGRKQAEEALRGNEKRLEAILEASADPMLVYDQAGNTTYVNPAFTRVFGWEAQEILGRRIPFVPQDQRGLTDDYIRQLYQRGGTVTLQTKRLTKQGELRDIVISAAGIPDPSGRVTGMVVNLTDVTHTNRLEAQLRQSQKMEAIGTLAGGIAHDFNNILGAIMGYAEIALQRAMAGQANRQELAQVLQGTERARNLVKQILTFSRKAEADLRPLNLNKSVRQVLSLLEPALPKMVRIETHLEPALDPVRADATQMEQVLLNLAGNAADAMPEGGRLLIETQNIFLCEDYCSQHLELNPGRYVMLMVSDTGVGMTPQVMEHIFDPFFTTKGVGQGTGLGLSTVFGIVKGHGGEVICYSEPGLGTTFKVYLPVFSAETPDQALPEAPTPRPLGGKETILLVDDEVALRDLGRQTLEGVGYQVLTAASGEEALALYQAQGQAVDLVVMDLGMPGMGGHKCLKEILTLNPQARVVIASGYSANGQVKASLESGAAAYVAKPFRRVDLLTTVRDVLDRA